jgi:outer membrane protein assembly factor BamB
MSTQVVRRRWLRLLIGLVLVALVPLGFYVRPLWRAADLDPRPTFVLTIIGQIVSLVCVLALPVWLLFFSGFASRTKAVIVVLVLLACGGAAGAIDSFDLDGDLLVHFHFRWAPRAADLLDRRLEEVDSSQQLPPINLTIDEITDFPRYRGAHGNGVVIATDLLEMNPDKKEWKLLWRQPCGGGFAGFAVAGNVAITVEQRRDKETIVCYDRDTGREHWTWEHSEKPFRHIVGSGPRATPSIDGGDVFSLGANGQLVCLAGATGKEKWTVDIIEDNQSKVVQWGMTSSPLVVGDLVIVNAGVDESNNAGQSLAAYHRKTGGRVWAGGSFRAGYSSPMKARLAGREQVLIFHASGLSGFDLKSGEELWQHPWPTGMDMNIIQPLLLDEDKVFLSSETSNGGAVIQVYREGSTFATKVIWANHNLCSKFSNPIAKGGAIYGLSDGRLVCIGQRNGKRLWRGKSYGHGQILASGADLLVLSETGMVAVVKIDKRQFAEVATLEALTGRTWNTPALAGRQLFLRNDKEMACYELPLME